MGLLSNLNPLNWGKSKEDEEFGGEGFSVNLDPPSSLAAGARTGKVDMNSTVTFGTDKYGEVSGNTTQNAPKKL